MIIYPAIDIKDGQCVRLVQGDFARKTVYGADPAAVAARWRDAGAAWLHLVDLDGARSGGAKNRDAVKRILETVSLPVQLGGGIRTMRDVDETLALGVTRVIIGTAALNDLAFLQEAVDTYGDKIAVGVDASDGRVAVSAWESVSDKSALSFIEELQAMGVRTVIYTDIARDGMLTGPNIPMYREAARIGLTVIASGGVGNIDDVQALHEAGMPGVIIGKALYENAVDLSEAVRLYA